MLIFDISVASQRQPSAIIHAKARQVFHCYDQGSQFLKISPFKVLPQRSLKGTMLTEIIRGRREEHTGTSSHHQA